MGKVEGLMSVREADRAAVIRDVVKKRLGRSEAAERLGIGVRQIKRLARRYRERGAAGLVSGHRGKRPNNAIDAGVRREVVDLVRKRYRISGRHSRTRSWWRSTVIGCRWRRCASG